jgi:uncharacterized delta-60 repeat protein
MTNALKKILAPGAAAALCIAFSAAGGGCVDRTGIAGPSPTPVAPSPIPSGLPDASFGVAGVVTTTHTGGDHPSAMLIQPDGKILVAGLVGGSIELMRYTTSGTLDPSFGTAGIATYSSGSLAFDTYPGLALQSSGKIVVATSAYVSSESEFVVIRFGVTGALDTTFGTSGVTTTAVGSVDDFAYSIAVQSDDKILVGGTSNTGSPNYNDVYAIARLSASGTLDAGFGTSGVATVPGASLNGDDAVLNLLVQSDGKIVATGGTTCAGKITLARFSPAGALDASFGTAGVVNSPISSFGSSCSNSDFRGAALQADGSIVVTGYQANPNASDRDGLIARFTAAGAPDGSFGTNGLVNVPILGGDDAFTGVAVQSNGQIVAAGYSDDGTEDVLSIVRVNSDGTFDTSFGPSWSGKETLKIGSGDAFGAGVALQADGKIVVAVDVIGAGLVNEQFGVVRLEP